MKLIIEIDENVYTRLFDNGIQDNEISTDDICEMARALRLGTPIPDNATVCDIEQIRAEIEDCKQYQFETYGIQRYFKIDDIRQIIDKYTK